LLCLCRVIDASVAVFMSCHWCICCCVYVVSLMHLLLCLCHAMRYICCTVSVSILRTAVSFVIVVSFVQTYICYKSSNSSWIKPSVRHYSCPSLVPESSLSCRRLLSIPLISVSVSSPLSQRRVEDLNLCFSPFLSTNACYWVNVMFL
jgi:hypothetical protein